jgi:membrane protein required for colicin V production
MLGPLTVVDLALIAVALLSALLAMYRGLTREILSITSWAVAGAAVGYFVLFHKKFAEELAQQMGAPVFVAQIVIGAVLFLIILIIVHLITARISDAILDSRIGMIDRVLGFLFGAVRGFIIVLIPFMFYVKFFPDPTQQIDVIKKAASHDMLLSWGNALSPAVEQLWEKINNKSKGDGRGPQQGFINHPPRGGMSLAFHPALHISVTNDHLG